MRRHPPRLIRILAQDKSYLEKLVRDGHTEQRIARRARVLLAMANPGTMVEDLAYRLGISRTTIWNVCRRYEQSGLGALHDAPRSGRPREVSPPGTGRD
jgi:transposase